MELRFTKMEGTGNDFIFLEGDRYPLSPTETRDLCHRRRGIGADGVVLLSRRDKWTMEIWNADGSPAGMCGNALRCSALYLDRRGYLETPSIELDTADGLKTVEIRRKSPVYRIRADLGRIRWDPADIPVRLTGPVLDRDIEADGRLITVSALSMGNPHCVLFTDDLSDEHISAMGPILEHHPLFPDRCNVEFTRILNRREVRVRVWERGCGETEACGTGAAAVCAAASETGRTDRKIKCHMPGGTLELERTEDDRVQKTGPARIVFQGVIGNEILQ